MARKIKDPEERRQELLKTALELFSEKGYEQTSITDIAGRLGIAQGLCYRYFPSKEALLDGALEQYAQEQVSRMVPMLCDPGRTLRQKLKDFPPFTEYEEPGSPSYALYHGENSQKLHHLLSYRICELLTPLVAQQLRLAQEQGEISTDDPETAASFLVYGQLGILNSSQPADQKTAQIRRFLHSWLER